ncbi:MAG: hypothetical protein KatS3mg096_129 [Candidatus Parcubacteria bacterium]|nr:MAG: hypothetical protein KatS3mg096_129 [Candidatus Parcubacteria bacterium]
MKKIYLRQNELLEIAKIIKDHLPGIKVFIHRHERNIVLDLPRNIDRLKIEELKTKLKIKYSNYQFSVFYF